MRGKECVWGEGCTSKLFAWNRGKVRGVWVLSTTFWRHWSFFFLCVCVCQSEFLHLRASRLELEELDRDTGTARASQLMDRWGFSCKYNIWDVSALCHLHTHSPWLVYKWINPVLLRVQQLLLGHSQQPSFIYSYTHTQMAYRPQLYPWHYYATTSLCVCVFVRMQIHWYSLMYPCVPLIGHLLNLSFIGDV